MKISELLAWHGSDKCLLHHEHGHSYGPLYDEILTPIQNSVRVVFEVGVLGGASLRAWRDFFPNAEVRGLDISSEPFEEDRVRTFKGDATDPDDVARAVGGLEIDFFCDDGSHWDVHQIKTFEIVKPLLAPGAVCAIEDLQWESAHASLRERGFTIHDFRHLRQKSDDVVAVYRHPV